MEKKQARITTNTTLDRGFPAWIQTLAPRDEGISEIQAKRFP